MTSCAFGFCDNFLNGRPGIPPRTYKACPTCWWGTQPQQGYQKDHTKSSDVTRDGKPKLAGERKRAGTASKRRAGPKGHRGGRRD